MRQTLLFMLLFAPYTLLFAEHNPCAQHKINTSLIDSTYHYLNIKFCQPAVWFDDFFTDQRSLEDSRAGTIIRWYNDMWLSNTGAFKHKMKLNARLHLPNLSHKLKLVIGTSSADFNTTKIDAKTEYNNLALRYDWIAKEQTSFNVKVTIRPSIAFRYRYNYPLNERVVLTFTQKVQQRKKTNAASSQFDIDFSIDPIFLLRWSNEVNIKKDMQGVKFISGLTLYQYISDTQAINYHAHINSQTQPEHRIIERYLSMSYRHNILRKWFFYTLTPTLTWQTEDPISPLKDASITLRLEVLFSNI